jgi:hypothetical protein
MRFLFGVIGISFLLSGCFVEEPKPSAVDYVRLESNQTHHYRPIHKTHTDWSAQKMGKNLTMRSDGSSIKLSARYAPDQVLIRKSGEIVGTVESADNMIQIRLSSQAVAQQEQITLRCMGNETAILTDKGFSQSYKLGDHQAATTSLSARELSDPRRIAVYDTDDLNADPNQCKGIQIDSPFNAMGTLIFHEERVALEFRSALAWYVTIFKFCGIE